MARGARDPSEFAPAPTTVSGSAAIAGLIQGQAPQVTQTPFTASSAPQTAPTGDPIPTDPAQFQQYLNDHGANPPLEVDGVVGPLTLSAAQQLGVPVPQNLAPSNSLSVGPDVSGGGDSGSTGNTGGSPASLVGPGGPLPGSDEDVIAKFGAYAWALNIPQVGDKLRQAAAEGWAPAQLQAAIEQTDWWRTTQASIRSWTEQTNDDPASAQAKIDQAKADITQAAAKLGVSIAPDRLNQIATDSLRLGWDNTQLQAAIGAEFHYTPGGQTGSLATAEGSLRDLAQQYLVPLDDQTLASYEQQIAAGTATPDQFRLQFVQHAQSLFPGLSPQITVSNSTQNALAPWRNVAAQELGVAPDTIDFTQPKWNRFVNQIDPKSGQATPMSLYDTQRTLRSDATYGWQYTKNGQDAAYQFQHSFLQAVGKAPA